MLVPDYHNTGFDWIGHAGMARIILPPSFGP